MKVCFNTMFPEQDQRTATLRALARWTYRDGRKHLTRHEMREIFEQAYARRETRKQVPH